MGKLILIMIIVIIAFTMYNNKIKIKWKTFFHKGFMGNRGVFGVYCYDGKQGNFKTYSVIEYLLTEIEDVSIYSNVHFEGVEYTPIGGLDDLLKLRSQTDCIIVFDEIFTAITKGTKIDKEIMDFLSQMRKRRIIFITTAQEWLEINITLRRYCRYRINCSYRNFLFFTIIIKKFYDAENMKWDVLENEYVAPLICTTLSKPNLFVAQSYDTFQQISTTNNKELDKQLKEKKAPLKRGDKE